MQHWRWGTETITPVDMLVGLRQAYVAEAKRRCRRVGMTSWPGRRNLDYLRDTCDAEMAATDLIARRRRPSSPAVLLTNPRKLARMCRRRLKTFFVAATARSRGSLEELRRIICATRGRMGARQTASRPSTCKCDPRSRLFLERMTNFGRYSSGIVLMLHMEIK